MSYFPEPYTYRRKYEVDFSDDATKCDLKESPGIDTLKFAKKVDLANLADLADLVDSDIGRLDIDKLETTYVDLGKLSNAVIKNGVVKKTVYDELVQNVSAIQTIDSSDLVKKLSPMQKL